MFHSGYERDQGYFDREPRVCFGTMTPLLKLAFLGLMLRFGQTQTTSRNLALLEEPQACVQQYVHLMDKIQQFQGYIQQAVCPR